MDLQIEVDTERFCVVAVYFIFIFLFLYFIGSYILFLQNTCCLNYIVFCLERLWFIFYLLRITHMSPDVYSLSLIHIQMCIRDSHTALLSRYLPVVYVFEFNLFECKKVYSSLFYIQYVITENDCQFLLYSCIYYGNKNVYSLLIYSPGPAITVLSNVHSCSF